MDPSRAMTRVLGTSELLASILSHLPQGDLLRLQRVSHSWLSLIRASPVLWPTTFTGQSDFRHTTTGTPRLNTFAISCLRWSPSLETDALNTAEFRSVQADQTLRAVAYENASWRAQYLTWPPVSRITVVHGTISQEEPGLPDLIIASRQGDPEPLESQEQSEDSDSDLDDEAPPLVLYIEDFPHNAGRECHGIRVLDLIYGLRLHYLQYSFSLEHYLRPAFEAPRGGEILAGLKKYPRKLMLDVTVLNM
ncbi:hypothetical protein PDE_02221 [Penicillium oxalicum 114-2]|uniref:F-box domain-containing protein n=1 Tax=Penicillium oxalicum (strain 114-2 / CGMCC 5302) TaxID=933388 RepID=S8AN03_PENO1|nr:hypothetical protein PDE_02221 [Penicillium oxalicum 114-2]